MDAGKGFSGSPVVLRPTAQEFLGLRYYLCGFYFQRDGRRLHRAVWEYHNGPIPKGWHVHHKDEDRSNNCISNLELLHGSAHASLHSTGKPSTLGDRARAAAAEWHGSDKGRDWHKAHWQKTIGPKMAERVKLSCVVCGKEYETRSVMRHKSRYCHQNCRAVALRRRRAAERKAGRLLPGSTTGASDS